MADGRVDIVFVKKVWGVDIFRAHRLVLSHPTITLNLTVCRDIFIVLTPSVRGNEFTSASAGTHISGLLASLSLCFSFETLSFNETEVHLS